jgi:multidrug efflux pump subunit AcrA (membrane-fusion protein)
MATADGGWTVEVRLADGGSEIRPVKLGVATAKSVQILEGLEAGQVVVLPD